MDPAEQDRIIPERPAEAALGAAPTSVPGLVRVALIGAAMGAADVVPGFSGGTVALVSGIYERLIANIRQGARALSLLVQRRVDEAWQAVLAIEWPFVGALLAGLLVAVFSLASVLRRLVEERPVAMSAVFLGLVLAATAIAVRELRRPTAVSAILVAASAVATFVGLGATAETVDEASLLNFFVGGAVAICAMILPGISGSFLLLLLGLYVPVLTAVEEFSLVRLLTFALGCVVGLALFSTLLNWLLRRAHDLVLAVLLGLMLGSVRILWPWPADGGLANAELGGPAGNEWLLALSLSTGAFAVVWMLSLLLDPRARRTRHAGGVVASDG